jgi:hypothetical protein
VAEGTDAARERVLAARAQLGDELEVLEASARAAVDIPAKIKRSPAKAAAVAGGAGFLVVGGPRRVFNGVKRAVKGPSKPMPKSMLPDEIEKTLRKLGTDGEAVRGAIERDFADYAKKASKDRSGLKTILLLSVARPVLTHGSKTAARWLFSSDEIGFGERLEQVRARIDRIAAARAETAEHEKEARSAGPATSASSNAAPPAPPAPAAPDPKPKTGSLRDDVEDDSGA